MEQKQSGSAENKPVKAPEKSEAATKATERVVGAVRTPLCYQEGIPLSKQVMEARGQGALWERWTETTETLLAPGAETVSDEWFSDPFHLLDMDKAVECLLPVIAKKGAILIHGDYDTDGVTATVILLDFFSALGIKADFYIPERQAEGYGLSAAGLDFALEARPDALITVDCGSQSFIETERLEQAGIPVVVTDHHRCLERLPMAHAVVNPNRQDESGELSLLAGAGVALKLCLALCRRLGSNVENLWLAGLDLAALGTVADMVPLWDENRLLVQAGLRQMRETPRPGIAALLNALKLDTKQISASTLGYTISPRINACGRMGRVDPAVRLLSAATAEEAAPWVSIMEQENVARKTEEQRAYEEARCCLARKPECLRHRIILVAGRDWHPGVIGIIASRLTQDYVRPAIVLTLDENTGEYRGSARSIGQIDILSSIQKCAQYLSKFGGHRQAAGLELPETSLESFRRALAETSDSLPLNALDDERETVDLSLPPEALTLENAEDLRRLEPFGKGNPEPLFQISGLRLCECRKVGKDGSHLRIGVEPLSNREMAIPMTAGAAAENADSCSATRELRGAPVYGVFFGAGELAQEFNVGDDAVLTARLRVSHFRGETRPELLLTAMTPQQISGGGNDGNSVPGNSAEQPIPVGAGRAPTAQRVDQLDVLEELYQLAPSLDAAHLAAPFGIDPDALLPGHELLRALYPALAACLADQAKVVDYRVLQRLVSSCGAKDDALMPFHLARALDIYSEAGLICRIPWNETHGLSRARFCLAMTMTPERRVQLTEMPTYRRLHLPKI